MNYYAGLSGLQLPIPKYQYPEEFRDSSRLTYFASFFNSIEINSSFYKIPMHKTVARWALEVPDGFRFTFKLFREITHGKELSFDPLHIPTFINAINNVGNKKACILIQFPPSLTTTAMGQLERLLQQFQIPEATAWKTAVEFRNKAWYHPDVYDMLESYHAALVFQDIPKSATPLSAPVRDFVYLRFHGPSGNYRDSYDDTYLSEYASYVTDWLSEGKMVYVYFNNTAGDAFKNLRRFNEMVRAS